MTHNEQEDRRIRRLQARQLNEDDNERDRYSWKFENESVLMIFV